MLTPGVLRLLERAGVSFWHPKSNCFFFYAYIFFFVLAQSSLSKILAEYVGWIRVMGTGLYLPLIIKASSDLSGSLSLGKVSPKRLVR